MNSGHTGQAEPVDPTTGSAAAHYAAMRRRSAARRWLAAAALGGIVGVIANLALPWQHSVLAALVTVIGLTIWDHRHGTLADLWPGNRHPHRLAAIAARLEQAGWTALPAPSASHGGPRLAAYLLIGPGGVFLVDHQVWWAPDRVTTDPATGLLMVGGKPAARRVASVKGAAAAVTHALARRLPGEEAVRPIVSVDGPMLDHTRLVAGVAVLPIADLIGFLHGHHPLLGRAEITALTEHTRRLYAGAPQ